MGCDIHLHVEVKIDNRWHHYAQVEPPRHYGLFAKMAGVRNDGGITPIAPPRGLPGDISTPTRLDFDRLGTDAHTASWLNSADVGLLSKWAGFEASPSRRCTGTAFDLEDWLGLYLYGNSFASFNSYPYEYPAGLQDFRFVFWFDN